MGLKDMHSSVFHSDYVFESINSQPFNYKKLKVKEELSKLKEKRMNLLQELESCEEKNEKFHFFNWPIKIFSGAS